MSKQRNKEIRQVLKQVDGQAQAVDGLAKHHKMASNPFLFFRGSAQLYYADLVAGKLLLPAALTSLPLTTVMGDCHILQTMIQ